MELKWSKFSQLLLRVAFLVSIMLGVSFATANYLQQRFTYELHSQFNVLFSSSIFESVPPPLICFSYFFSLCNSAPIFAKELSMDEFNCKKEAKE